MLHLHCSHDFCKDCLKGQLAARWSGPRVVFGYLNCALCRAPLEHAELEELLAEHQALRQRVVNIAAFKFREDGLVSDLVKALGREASDEEVRLRAEAAMAVFMCNDCSKPYCGGRADCAALLDECATEQERRCHECEWAALAAADDRRCMPHGHRYAIYKCDSCCAVAVWCCDGHHYCQRCHNNPFSDKDFPCPGPERCPLGIPHPRNMPGNINDSMERPSFVLGCSACLGPAADQQADLGGPDGYAFGYPARDWKAFAGGQELLAAVDAEEVRGRLRALQPPLPHDGSLAECAERLLLREQRVRLPQDVLKMDGSLIVLKRRLEAVGLRSDGPALECAQRLLFLLYDVPLDSLKLWDAHEALRPPQNVRHKRRKVRVRGALALPAQVVPDQPPPVPEQPALCCGHVALQARPPLLCRISGASAAIAGIAILLVPFLIRAWIQENGVY